MTNFIGGTRPVAKSYLAKPTHTMTNQLAVAIQFVIVAVRTKVQVVEFGTTGSLESVWRLCHRQTDSRRVGSEQSRQRFLKITGGDAAQ